MGGRGRSDPAPAGPGRARSQPGGSNQPSAERARVDAGAPGKPGDPKGVGSTNMPPRNTWLTFLVVLGINYLLMRVLFPDTNAPVTVPYTAFKEQVAAGNDGENDAHGGGRGGADGQRAAG